MSADTQLALLAARFVLASELARRSGSARQKLATATLEKEFLRGLGRETSRVESDDLLVLLDLQEHPAQAAALMTELVFTPPFAPHDIVVPDEALHTALPRVMELLGLKVAANLPWRLRDEAKKAYGRRRGVSPLAVVGAMTAVATLAVPVVGPMFSAYTGAAALTSLLAGLGGTMQGGMALLGVGGLLGGGLLAGSVAQALRALGADGLRLELMKLEVTQRLMWPFIDVGGTQAEQVVVRLQALRQDHIDALKHERTISDPGSVLFKEYDTMTELYDQAITRFEAWEKRL